MAPYIQKPIHENKEESKVLFEDDHSLSQIMTLGYRILSTETTVDARLRELSSISPNIFSVIDHITARMEPVDTMLDPGGR